MIKTVLFDLEEVLALERSNNSLAINPAFTADFDRLSKEGYHIYIIRRKGVELYETIKEHFAEFYKATIIDQEGLEFGKDETLLKLNKALSSCEIKPSEAFYFWAANNLEGERYNEVHTSLKNDIGFAGTHGLKRTFSLHHNHSITRIFRYQIFDEPAVSETIALTEQEITLSGQLLSLIALRMCYNAVGYSNYDWPEYHLRLLVAAKWKERGKHIKNLNERHFNKMARELSPLEKYDKEKHRMAEVGALIDHECISAYERAIYALKYWRVVQNVSSHVYEMIVDAAELYDGKCDLLKQGNREGFALMLCSFLTIHVQNAWGLRYSDKKEFEIVISKEIVTGFKNLGLIETGADGLIWSSKMEPFFDFGGGPGCEAGEFFEEASGKKLL